jgi:hypothetical protein
MLPLVWSGSEKNVWQNLPGFERRYAPLSDHLFDYFCEHSSAFLGQRRDIKETYLLSEILPAIASLDHFEPSELESKLMGSNGMGQNYVWSPVAGKIGWDHWSTKPIFERLEADNFPKELAEAGFGKGNARAVQIAAAHVQRAIGNLHW